MIYQYEDPFPLYHVKEDIHLVDIDRILEKGMESELKLILNKMRERNSYRDDMTTGIAFSAKWSEFKNASEKCWCMVCSRIIKGDAIPLIKKMLGCERVEIHQVDTYFVILTDCTDWEKADMVSDVLLTIECASMEKRAAFVLEHYNLNQMNKQMPVYGELFDLVNVAFDAHNKSTKCYSAWRRKIC